MLKRIQNIIFKLKIRMVYNDHERKNKYLRKIFWHIGERTAICTDNYGNEPYLVWIGNDVIVATGVRFINHDASCWNMYKMMNIKYEKKHEKVGAIVLKDNCFIGANTILLPNVVVGKNSVVAAGAVVNKNIPDNEVWGGCPAKFIMSVSELAKKDKEYYEKIDNFWENKKNTNIIYERQKMFENLTNN